MKKKNVNKYIKLVILFVIIMTISLIYFMDRFDSISLKNNAKTLLKDLYNLDPDKYLMKDGIIYQNDYKIGLKSSKNMSGEIEIDKYYNIRFNLENDKKCISKTYEGNIKVSNGKCNTFKDIEITINRNNNKIAFVSETKNLEYKISNEDDYKGKWIHEDYKDNIVLKSYSEGKNYIWFKDSEGNISEALTFEVDCLYTSKAVYDKNVFYCSGSTVKIDNMDFVVIKDNNDSIKLMKFLGLDDTYSQCYKSSSEFCFYEKKNKNIYDWNNSYINYYLNSEFINWLSNDIKEMLISSDICIDDSVVCDKELCIGRTKEEIESNGYVCNNYVSSKARLITYDEFDYVHARAKNKNVLNGYYWSINSFYKDYGSSIQYNQDIYVYEDLTKKLDIKPLIILRK